MKASERAVIIVLAQNVRRAMDNLDGSPDVSEQRLYDALSIALRDACVVCKLGAFDGV